MRMTLTWVIPPLDPVLPSNWVTLAFTGSDSMDQQILYLYQILISPRGTMHLSYYQTFPARVHPQFVETATRYSAVKARRKTEEIRRLEAEQKYFYTTNREKMLERKIISRSLQLERAQSSRMRRLQEIRRKQQFEQARQRDLEKLRSLNKDRRHSSRERLQQTRCELHNKKHLGWMKSKEALRQMEERVRKNSKQEQHQNALSRDQIKRQEQEALQKVERHHLQRNREHLATYLERMRLQNRIRKQNLKSAIILTKGLKPISQSVKLKQEQLKEFQSQISKYQTDIYSLNRSRLQGRRKRHSQTNSEQDDSHRLFSSLYKKSTNQ